MCGTRKPGCPFAVQAVDYGGDAHDNGEDFPPEGQDGQEEAAHQVRTISRQRRC